MVNLKCVQISVTYIQAEAMLYFLTRSKRLLTQTHNSQIVYESQQCISTLHWVSDFSSGWAYYSKTHIQKKAVNQIKWKLQI